MLREHKNVAGPPKTVEIWSGFGDFPYKSQIFTDFDPPSHGSACVGAPVCVPDCSSRFYRVTMYLERARSDAGL